MLIIKNKESYYTFKEPDTKVSVTEKVLIPKINNKNVYRIEKWYELHKVDIDMMILSYMSIIKTLKSDEHLIYCNINKMQQMLLEMIYKKSINKSKNFIL